MNYKMFHMQNKDLEVDSHISLYTTDFATHFINGK